MIFTQTQTSLKDLEKEATCAFRWKSQWIEGLISSISNEHMKRGHYFEGLCIGGGASGKVEIDDLPRLRNGNKGVDQLRIEQQAVRFKDLFDPNHSDFLGYTILQSQLYLENKSGGGTIDFMAVDQKNNPCLFDLKLTGSLTYGWWSDISKIDMLQQLHYHNLYLDNFTIPKKKKLKNLLAIFDYSTKKSISIVELFPKEYDLKDTKERFSVAECVIEEYSEKGWSYTPSPDECKICPLKCDKRDKSTVMYKKE